MPRWSLYGQSETKVLTEGDRRFNGLDMTRDRAILEPGILARSENKRLNNGIASTRPGCVLLSDFNPLFTNRLVGSGVFSNPNGDEVLLVAEFGQNFIWALQFGKDPIQVPIDSGLLTNAYETGILDCTRVKFVQAFDHVLCLRTPTGKHSTLVWDGTGDLDGNGIADTNFTPVTRQQVFGTNDIIIPGGVDPANPTQLYQQKIDASFNNGISVAGSQTYQCGAGVNFAYTDVGLTIAGTNLPQGTFIRQVDGPTQVQLSNYATASGTGLPFTIFNRNAGGPPFFCNKNGEPFQDRILLYNDQDPSAIGRDTFIMTETELWDQYNQATGIWRINAGEANVMTRVMAYYRGGVLIFFRRGIHILENFTNPPPDGVIGDQRMVNSFLGAVSCTAMEQVGVDVYFLSEPGKGVYRISEAVQDQIAVNPLAVSDQIQPVMDNVDWNQAALWATIKSLGPYIFLGVPQMDQVSLSGNTKVCVYNQYTRQWESIDGFTDSSFSFQEMHVISCAGVRQLITVNWNRKQIIGMYSEGVIADQVGVGGSSWPITDTIETRGYSLGAPTDFKRYQRTCLAIQTFDPNINLTSITDGHNEIKLLNDTPLVKDRLRTYIHGQEFFDPDTDDPDQIRREDYSAATPNYAIEDFEEQSVGPIATWGGTNPSIFNGDKQQTLERFMVRQNGRWASIQVVNSRGNCDVLAVSVDGIPVQEGVHMVA